MKVRIYKPSKTAMQSIHAKKKRWVLEYEPLSKKVPNDLMGWTSSSDMRAQIKLKFDTKEDAVTYAEKQGWEYAVMVERERKVKPRNYGDNFKYRPTGEEAQ